MIFIPLVMMMIFITSCTIYQSPERKSFESESPTFRIQSLQKISCSNTTLAVQASASRLIDVQDEVSVWEHIISNQSVFESTHLNKSEYCLYGYQK